MRNPPGPEPSNPQREAGTKPSEQGTASPVPTISLPKGGGAIRGIGEKFAANPVTGTGSMSVPIATSPGRSGFGPQLSLSYDSGAGNGAHGWGWNHSLPSITRKTDKGLPQYQDASESDVFILSGAEDLVPVGEASDDPAKKFRIQRYRPRIEGLFALIERWTEPSGQAYWRSISRDNITTLYGRNAESRIVDPADPTRIFSWLICESSDGKGNAIRYEYQAENSDGVDLSAANEKHRSRSAQRYLKRIKYGNKTPRQPNEVLAQRSDWMFEVVFDYGEGHVHPEPAAADGTQTVRAHLDGPGAWPARQDPFSSYRAGFEVRTYRLCRRVLMFHHFPDELGIDDYLVRATHFKFSEDPSASFITAVTQSGYLLQVGKATYLEKSLPPVEFEYSKAEIDETIREVDAESLENLPYGLDGSHYQWVDLDGEGLSGILTEQGGAWFYKRNLGAFQVEGSTVTTKATARFAPVERLPTMPSPANLSGGQQLLDLAGDGQLDVVELERPVPGFFERTPDEGWETFTPFASLPNLAWKDPNLRFVDLTGDGHADILITEDEVLTWYPSLAEEGFGPAEKVRQALEDEAGPRLVFADGTQSVYLSDMSGDGLTDLVRIRNGNVCYWPNLGYGRFGAKVTMDHAPWFDAPDQFDQKRIRLADIDGSGTVDILYLGRDGVHLYFNRSGNSWSDERKLDSFPRVDNLSSVMAADLLGNGTACLVWSSPLPGDARRPMRYIDLMGGRKPHLLVKAVNNLGAEKRVDYAPSTKFYLQDKYAGKPWITRLPFPVHVVERVETYDYISRNRFVTRYTYHHGYFDGVEREFRGFGMVEQTDTELLAVLINSDVFPVGDNVAAESHVPPVHTKTWFHTGVYLGREHVSDFFAGLLNATDQGEYFREPGLTDAEARALLLPDTVLPQGLTLDEEREACRALKGAMLRQEVYAFDGSDKEAYPYTVTEQNFTIRALLPQVGNRHAVFFTHAREVISFHYERNPADPRISHALTLEVNEYGNVRKSLAIGYGRRQSPLPELRDRDQQTATLITYTENGFANPIDDAIRHPDDYRTPLPSETQTYELTGFKPENNAARFSFDEWTRNAFARLASASEIPYERAPGNTTAQKRLIEHVRTLSRRDDLTALRPLHETEPLALPGESYKLAFTPGLLAQVFQRPHAGQAAETLLPDPAAVLGGQAKDRGGYVQSQALKADGLFPDSDLDDHWWIPSGRPFLSSRSADSAADELVEARKHFFLPRRYRDPFGQDATVSFDAADLLIVETRDPLGNRVTVGANDYRVLQPRLVNDPNRNQVAVAFDALGLVVGTAVMGKPLPAPAEGDSLAGFAADLTQAEVDGLHDAADPHATAPALLQSATTRIVYDLDRFQRTQRANPQDSTKWLPPYAATLARETHTNDPLPLQGLRIQIGFSYSDGFGREIQKKIQAEPEKLGGVAGPARWVGSGWTIFNNKGKPVRQYEPFFSATHRFEFGVKLGVSPVLFYDPAEHVITTLHPNHSYEKLVFDPWQQTTYDVNDTAAARNAQTGDPRTDPDISGYVEEYFKAQSTDPAHPWQTWREQRQTGALGQHEQAAATKAAAHADTPTTAHFDALGRPFLTLARNRVVCANHPLDGTEDVFATRVELDIEGNQRAVRDADKKARNPQGNQVEDELGRIVMHYAYDMLGNRIHQLSMEAGARWMLNDITGKPIRTWDSRDHNFVTAYDALRRPVEQYVRGTTAESDPRTLNRDILVDKIEYGEGQPNAEALNLRTRIYRHSDSAGVATNAAQNPHNNKTEAYDFKGNLLRSTRQLISDYRAIPHWLLHPPLDAETFTSSTRYDALNRPTQSIAPHSSLARAKRNVAQPVFNEANLLERVDVWLDRAAEPAGLLNPTIDAPSPVGVRNIDYDSKGQRQRADYTNGASTFYDYDPLTFRLVHLLTKRVASTFPGDCPQPAPAGWPGCQVQNLSYTFDPAGNITHIQDDAQQTVYFKNQRVEASNGYTYDALYRLIEAKGREHLGQGRTPIPHSHDDVLRTRLPHPGDGTAMGTYIERYVYDAVGNFLQMQHLRTDAQVQVPGWSRSYAYAETSLIEDGTLLKASNRLSSTTLSPDGDNPVVEPYQHDTHGSMIRMPHLGSALPGPNMHWDYKDQLRQTDVGSGSTAYYVYDASGQRVRKVWQKAPGLTEERIYLSSFEIFRRHGGAIGADTATLERETLHIMDDKQRIALVETRTLDTAGNDPAPQQLIRYQFGNHLGSASLELDDQAQIISYEEYTPYGSTSYRAVRSQTESAKRYRYTGKERDEESGFNYHVARHYAPWLARWVKCDPASTADGLNQYRYVRGNPTNFFDLSGKATQPDLTAPNPGLNIQGFKVDGSSGTPVPAAPLPADFSVTQGFKAGGPSGTRVAAGPPPGISVIQGFKVDGNSGTRVPAAPEPVSMAEVQGFKPGGHPGARVTADRVPSMPAQIQGFQRDGSPGVRIAGDLGGRKQPVVIQGIQKGGHPGTQVKAGPVQTHIGKPLMGFQSNAANTQGASRAITREFPAVTNPATSTAPPTAAAAPAAAPAASSGSTPVPAAETRTSWGNVAGRLARDLPFVAEAEATLVGSAALAYGMGAAKTGAALMGGAEFVPVVGGAIVAGALIGNVTESVVASAGGSKDVAQGAGMFAAVAAGAGVGALIGAPIGGVGAIPGAIVGGLFGLGGYLLTR